MIDRFQFCDRFAINFNLRRYIKGIDNKKLLMEIAQMHPRLEGMMDTLEREPSLEAGAYTRPLLSST